jgi:hypothetical protein
MLLNQRDTEWPSQHMLPIYRLLIAQLDNLTKLWELVISHQHLAILSNTPSCACAAALSVVSLVMPIRFDGDLRTHLTVKDVSFSALAKLGKGGDVFPASHSVVVAATNPFFVRALSGWRNVMAVRDVSSSFGAVPSAPTSGASPGSPVPPPSPSTGKGWNNLQWSFTDVFESPFPFVVDHADATSTIRSRLQMAASLPAQVAVEVNPLKQLTMCDETVRKYFASLTMEFLAPINAWFQGIACRLQPFSLCSSTGTPAAVAALVDSVFPAQGFLDHLKENRKAAGPSFLRGRAQYSQYKQLYERFCGGVLFASWITTLAEQHVRQELADFSADKWASIVTDEQQRIDMFISLHSLCTKELETMDPDVVFVTMATAALAEMALLVQPPFRDQFIAKVERLRL